MSPSSDIDSLPFAPVPLVPDFAIESGHLNRGSRFVAGVDEAGRGPLAGPVVAAAVILDPERIPDGLNDSKKLSELERETLFVRILETASVAWASAAADEIDQVNIREATLRAMVRASLALPVQPDTILIDGRDIPAPLINRGQALVKGDARSVSIAAASIVAKVIRDRMMVHADRMFPQYGFASHKGYGTQSHRTAIAEAGPCKLHRMSFAPMKFG